MYSNSLHLILQELHKEHSTLSKHGSVFCDERSFSFSEVYRIELSYLCNYEMNNNFEIYLLAPMLPPRFESYFPKICDLKCPAVFPSPKTICTESSALCSPQFWSGYNGAQNFIRKHAVDAKRIFISLSLISYVEMEVLGGLCVSHGLLRKVWTWRCSSPHCQKFPFCLQKRPLTMSWLEPYSLSV